MRVNDKQTIIETLGKISPDEIEGLDILLGKDKGGECILPHYPFSLEDDYETCGRYCRDNEICECLFDALLHRRITSIRFDGDILIIGTSECRGNTTNIDADVIEAVCELMRRKVEYEKSIAENAPEFDIDEIDDYELGLFQNELGCP